MPSALIFPSAVSRFAYESVLSLHLLLSVRREKCRTKVSSSRRLIVVSIQPKQIASSIISRCVGKGFPVCFLCTTTASLCSFLWFLRSQLRNSFALKTVICRMAQNHPTNLHFEETG